jgi:hypothetical protein
LVARSRTSSSWTPDASEKGNDQVGERRRPSIQREGFGGPGKARLPESCPAIRVVAQSGERQREAGRIARWDEKACATKQFRCITDVACDDGLSRRKRIEQLRRRLECRLQRASLRNCYDIAGAEKSTDLSDRRTGDRDDPSARAPGELVEVALITEVARNEKPNVSVQASHCFCERGKALMGPRGPHEPDDECISETESGAC